MNTFVVTVWVLAVLGRCVDSCCFPPQMEGVETLVNAHRTNVSATASTATYKFSLDMINKKTYAVGTVNSMGQTYNQTIFQDYATGKQYFVVNGKCTILPLHQKMMSCIPSDAELVLSTFQGIDDNMIAVDMFSFTYEGARVSLTVLKDSCALVSEHVETNDALSDVGFYGLTRGIKNPNVFNVPTACHNVSVSVIPGGRGQLRKRRYSTLFTSTFLYPSVK